MKSQIRGIITTNATTTLINESCVIEQIVIAVGLPGTSWQVKIQSVSPVMVFLPAVVLSSPSTPSWIKQYFEEPIYMPGGIQAVTAGTAAGHLSIWINILTGG
jgi:hypothetical protein